MNARHVLVLIVLALILIAPAIVALPAAGQKAPVPTSFDLNSDRNDSTNEKLANFTFSLVAQADLTPRTDGVRGSGKWIGGFRNGYESAFAIWQHEDPGAHPFVDAMRVQFQVFAAHPLLIPFRILDRGMPELCGSVTCAMPYPYETPAQIGSQDFSFPGATVEFYHHRPMEPDKVDRVQLLARFVVPAVSPLNSKVKWYYQGGGTVIATYNGVVALKLIFSAMDPFYRFRIVGYPTAGFD